MAILRANKLCSKNLLNYDEKKLSYFFLILQKIFFVLHCMYVRLSSRNNCMSSKTWRRKRWSYKTFFSFSFQRSTTVRFLCFPMHGRRCPLVAIPIKHVCLTILYFDIPLVCFASTLSLKACGAKWNHMLRCNMRYFQKFCLWIGIPEQSSIY